MSKLSRILLFAVAIMSGLTACRPSEPMPDTSPLITPADLPPSSVSPLPALTHTPRPGVAILHGVLFLLNPTITAPREDGVYLVHIDTEGRAPMVVPAVDPETSLQANVDEVTGQFFFADVPPGLYVLVAVTDNGQQLSVREFHTGEAAIITVGEEDLGQMVDLGIFRLP